MARIGWQHRLRGSPWAGLWGLGVTLAAAHAAARAARPARAHSPVPRAQHDSLCARPGGPPTLATPLERAGGCRCGSGVQQQQSKAGPSQQVVVGLPIATTDSPGTGGKRVEHTKEGGGHRSEKWAGGGRQRSEIVRLLVATCRSLVMYCMLYAQPCKTHSDAKNDIRLPLGRLQASQDPCWGSQESGSGSGTAQRRPGDQGSFRPLAMAADSRRRCALLLLKGMLTAPKGACLQNPCIVHHPTDPLCDRRDSRCQLLCRSATWAQSSSPPRISRSLCSALAR